MGHRSACIAALCAAAAIAPCLGAVRPPAAGFIAQAEALEARRDWAGARAAWERVIDTARATEADRLHAVARLHVLNDLVPPNADPRRANVWHAKAFIFRALDFTWRPKGAGADRHAHITVSDEEVALLRKGLDRFAQLVFEFSRGGLRLDCQVEVLDGPVTSLSGDDSFWLGPWDVEKLIAGHYKPGALDSVFGYVKLSDGKGQDVPAAMFGGTFGGDIGPGGAGWTGIMWYPGWMRGDGEVELHEWLHQVDWSFAARLRYPDEIVPSSDEGRVEGEQGGDPDYRRPKAEPNWFAFYRHLMGEHITSKMWSEARCRLWEGVVYGRDWLVLGPFRYQGDPAGEMSKAEWAPSSAPRAGQGVGPLAWTRLKSADDLVDLDKAFGGADYAAAYAFAQVTCDRPRMATLWLGYDDCIAAWVNGEEVYRSVGPQGATRDQAGARVRLRKGQNTVLLKVADIDGGWGFYARFGDAIGRAAEGIQWAPPP